MVWPFRRKSSRRKGADGLISTAYESTAHGAAPEMQDREAMTIRRQRSRTGRPGSKRGARGPNKLQRDSEKRTYSFSPGRDNIRIAKNAHHQHPVPPLPQSTAPAYAQTWSVGGPLLTSASTRDVPMAEKDWQRVPTLHKRKSHDMPRRKSSKRRKEEIDREAEIKAMSAFMPQRPATFDHLSGRPMKRDSKRMKDGLNRNFANPSSDISIPTAESMRSSMSSTSDKHASYKLKGMFSPHPTIRYAENPRFVPGASGFGSSEGSGRRRTLADRHPISEETMQANKRIDDLADDLTAGDIRELMERDKRRKERKKISDQLKMEKRLAKKVEKQRAAEAEAARNGTPPPQNMERGVLGRELAGLGIAGMAVSIKRRVSNASSRRKGKRPASLAPSDHFEGVSPTKPEFQRAISLAPTESESPTSEEIQSVIETAQVARLSRASMSPPTSPQVGRGHTRGTSNISEMMDLSKEVPPLPTVPAIEPEERRPSNSSKPSEASVHQPQSWRSFFKRRSTNKRASIPSSFSNTSRESALANSRQSQTYEIQRSTSNLPKRTMSKFREDLPEFPISPPDSRVQSPEADELPPIHTGFPKAVPGTTDVDSVARRHDTPTSGYRSVDANPKLREEPSASGNRSTDLPSPEPVAIMSQSLASIDSEGSWLSGRPKGGSKRGSLQPRALRNSASSLEKRSKSYSDSHEELGIAEDEYFSRLTPGADEMFEKSQNRVSGNPMPSSDEDDDSVASPSSPNTRWGAIARTPTVVRHEQRVKSREGLLTDFIADAYIEDDDAALESPTSPGGENESIIESPGKGIQRAISVTVPKGHARQVSAGSAKLLDVKPRGSSDLRRLSADNRTSEV